MTTEQESLETRLHGLAAFLPLFEASDFQFGSWLEDKPSPDGVLAFPEYRASNTAEAFVRAAYDHGWVIPFDWGEWKGTPEAARLRDEPTALAEATPEQLARLLTVCIRQDRFVEGELAGAYKSGLLTAIVRCAAKLEQLEGSTS